MESKGKYRELQESIEKYYKPTGCYGGLQTYRMLGWATSLQDARVGYKPTGC